jgi:hypothetical protein
MVTGPTCNYSVRLLVTCAAHVISVVSHVIALSKHAEYMCLQRVMAWGSLTCGLRPPPYLLLWLCVWTCRLAMQQLLNIPKQ